MAVHLFDNVTGPPTSGSNTSAGWEVGTRLTLTADAPCTQLRWYRFATGAGNKPTAMHLWDLTTHTQLENPTVPDTGAVGWQTVTLAAARPLDATHTYAATIVMPNAMSEGFWGNSLFSTAPAPFVGTGNLRCWQPGSTTGEPTSNDNVLVWGIDVTLGDQTIPPDPSDPVTVGNMSNTLAAWLISTGDNTHQVDGLPWLIRAELAATKALVDVIPEIGGTDWTKVSDIWKLSGDLADAEIAVWRAFFGDGKDRLTGTTAAGGTAFKTSDGRRATDLVAQIWSATTPARSLPPGTGWTMVDETDWDTTLAWNVGAHCYLVTVDSYPPAQPATSSPAGTWLYRLGWWAVLNGSYASGRQFLEFAQQYLYQNGLWMPGVALQARGGTTGSVQAWVTG